MKIFTAMLATETNTFSPFLTGIQNFEQNYLVRKGQHGEKAQSFVVPLIRWRDMAHDRGWTVAEGLAAFAMPAGNTLRLVYESLRDELLDDLRSAMPVDGVLLMMHGAMVAQGYDDCEGDVAARVREIVGPDVPIGVELDLHCHLTDQLIDNADVVITFKEYPHTDPPERAEELFTIIADAMEGKAKPTTVMTDCSMIGVYHTSNPPVRQFVDKMQALEQQDDAVLSVSLGHGFPWGDVADMGTRLLVVTDDDAEAGRTIGRVLAQEFFALRDVVQPHYFSLNGALDAALDEASGPIVLADVSDNAGGGAPNDSTFVLQRLLDRGIGNAAIGCIWDPVAVSVAIELGEGVELPIRIGGKMGPMSGDPVDIEVRIGKIALDATQPFGAGTSRLGHSVAFHADNGLDIVAISHRSQTFSPAVFTNVGIDPTQKHILIVKSMQHFHAGFEPIAARIIHVATPGVLVPDLSLLPYEKVNRELWPLKSE